MTELLGMWIINWICCFSDGQLRKIDPNTGEPGNELFEFDVNEDQDYNQKRYEALGDVSVCLHTYIHTYIQFQGSFNRYFCLTQSEIGPLSHITALCHMSVNSNSYVLHMVRTSRFSYNFNKEL
jgi:hypothetical protein